MARDIERQARAWARMEDEDVETVANTIVAIQDGYRCEQEDVPTDILAWAREHETGDR